MHRWSNPSTTWAPALSLLLTLASCAGGKGTEPEATDEGGEPTFIDDDRDGFGAEEDCNDTDSAVHSGAAELCDGIDNNCDGVVDEGVTTLWYADEDGDGFGDVEAAEEACSMPEGAVTNASDCDDGDESVYPGAFEICDGLDNDCDGEADDGERATWYADADGDGWGDAGSSVESCDEPEGYVLDDGDCNDASAEAYPGHVEVCDEIDNDCDTVVDEEVTLTWYEDRDGDDWGVLDSTTEACARPTGYAEEAGDCDDDDPAYHPYADESDCTDPHDYNCDGSVGYADDDADGWAACVECDDDDALVNPDALEICNTIDDDCDALIDDADPDADLSTGSAWYGDADRDGFGLATDALIQCEAPTGYVSDDNDCDDDDSFVNPDAVEVCNGYDDDCDALVDDADSDVDLSTGSTWYRDSDGDGYGALGLTAVTCDEPSGYTSSSTDCDDTSAAVRPGATEVCNGIDDDCDGLTDDADAGLDLSTGLTWYRDVDGDGFGDAASSKRSCLQPTGYVSTATDCNDASSAIRPTATELCDSVDNDCDGLIDDADSSLSAASTTTWYVDSDGDGYGASSGTRNTCTKPTGYSAVSTDCAALDNDCDIAIDEGMVDTDGDGTCDSLDTESCDGRDNDGDGSSDEGLTCTYKLVQSDLSSGLCVDDDLYVNQNGSRIYTDTSWGAQCGHTVTFNATPGDSLAMWAVDSVGGCRNMSDVYIVLVATGAGQKLATGYTNTCGHGASSSAFWSATVSVPGAF
jgi:hypothetical protein